MEEHAKSRLNEKKRTEKELKITLRKKKERIIEKKETLVR